MKITDNYIIVSSENNEGLWCPYGSMNTFLENWKLNKITKEEFFSSSNDYENKIEKCKSDIKKYEKEIKNALNDAKCEEYWIEHFRRNKKIKTLSRDVIEELIDCIYVHEGGNITIKFKYQDEYERVLNGINNEREGTI